MNTVRYRIEFWVFRALSWIVVVLPERVALGLCSLLGWFVGVVVGVRRVDTHQHLQIAFPERDPAWRRRVARGSYMHLAREGAMTIRLYRMLPEEIVRRTEVVGLEALRDAAARGSGAIVISGHLGNWEVAAAAVSAGVPRPVSWRRRQGTNLDRGASPPRPAQEHDHSDQGRQDGPRIHRRPGEGRPARQIGEPQ